MDKTKLALSHDELDYVIACLEAKMQDDYAGCDVEEKGQYDDYKKEHMLLNRIKRAFQRTGGETEIEKVLCITAWAEKNSGGKDFKPHNDENVESKENGTDAQKKSKKPDVKNNKKPSDEGGLGSDTESGL